MDLYLLKDGQQQGPYTLDQVRSLFAAGTLNLSDLAWYDGLTDWIPLQRVPGFSAPAPQPVSVAPPPPVSSNRPSPAYQRSGRPVLVWIISIFYFICCPLSIIALAVTPYFLFPTSRTLQTYEINVKRAADHATDPAVKERLLRVLQRIQDHENRINILTDHGVFYNSIAIFSSVLGFAGAVYLFQLRRQALPLFLISSGLAFVQNIYLYVGEGFFRDFHSLASLINLIVILLVWGLTIAILLYIWRLSRRGVLS